MNRSGYTEMSFIIRSFQNTNAQKEHLMFVLSPSLGVNGKLWELPSMIDAYGLENVHYSIVAPNEFQCPQSATTVVYFQNDIAAQKEIGEHNCGQKSVTYSVLTPSITFF
jgi:hypothetical protein